MPRRLTLIFLGGLLLLLIPLWLSRRPPEISAATKTPPPVAAAPAPTSAPAAPATSTTANATAPREMLAELRRALQRPNARRNEAVLTFPTEAAYRAFLARARAAGLTVVGQIDPLRTIRVRYDSLAALGDDMLQHSADYSGVGANYILQPPEATAPPAKEDRAAIREVALGNTSLSFLGVAGEHSQWGRGTTIAVLDSGVAGDATFGSGRLSALDIGLGLAPGHGAEDGHGTAVAALAAGLSADAPGVAPAANLLSVRVTDASGTSDIFTVAQGILAAVDAGAKILNISLGGYSTGAVLTGAIDYATAHGAILVAAAGNDQAAQLAWPAADPRVVSVGAVDALGQQVTFSNSGEQLQVSAPGYGVQTAWLDGQRVTVNGTSASAPFVAGAIAAVMSQNPTYTAAQAWQVLADTVSEAGAPGPDPDYGRGILNVGWAMNRNNPTYADPAVASHYYDAANNQVQFIVQNRGNLPVSGLSLDIAVDSTTRTYSLPYLLSGETTIINVPVNATTLAANGSMTFSSALNPPAGLNDQVPANNRKTTRLTAPKK
jgi:hypothetical protein